MTEKRAKWHWKQYAAALFAAVWLGAFSYRYVDPSSRHARMVLSHFPQQQVTSITIEPANSGSLATIAHPLTIKDAEAIHSFAAMFSHLVEHNPEHPNVTQEVMLRIQTKDTLLVGRLKQSNNDGTYFYCMSNIPNGWIFGTYRAPQGKELFDLIRAREKAGAYPPAQP